mmetsp:Transcript_8303/g.13878  ORF Transcript_8303/g.13878 Transcript_8303/m.13878 type:complete len:280 (-) Transcript_8303:1127-1966(-)
MRQDPSHKQDCRMYQLSDSSSIYSSGSTQASFGRRLRMKHTQPLDHKHCDCERKFALSYQRLKDMNDNLTQNASITSSNSSPFFPQASQQQDSADSNQRLFQQVNLTFLDFIHWLKHMQEKVQHQIKQSIPQKFLHYNGEEDAESEGNSCHTEGAKVEYAINYDKDFDIEDHFFNSDLLLNANGKNERGNAESEKQGFIGSYWDYPEEMRDNEYILYGYRCNYEGWFGKNGVIRTAFIFSNESVNVWSHLLAGTFFIATLITLFFNEPNMFEPGQVSQK